MTLHLWSGLVSVRTPGTHVSFPGPDLHQGVPHCGGGSIPALLTFFLQPYFLTEMYYVLAFQKSHSLGQSRVLEPPSVNNIFLTLFRVGGRITFRDYLWVVVNSGRTFFLNVLAR